MAQQPDIDVGPPDPIARKTLRRQLDHAIDNWLEANNLATATDSAADLKNQVRSIVGEPGPQELRCPICKSFIRCHHAAEHAEINANQE